VLPRAMEDEKLLLNVQETDATVPDSRKAACRVRPSPTVAILLSLLALFNFIGLIVAFASGNPLLWGVAEIWWLVLVDSVAGLFLASFLVFWAAVKLAHFIGVRYSTFHVVALVLDFFHYSLASLSGSIGIVFVFRLIVVQSEIDAQLGYTFWSLVAISIILLAKGKRRKIRIFDLTPSSVLSHGDRCSGVSKGDSAGVSQHAHREGRAQDGAADGARGGAAQKD
jgi:hypothetical protein